MTHFLNLSTSKPVGKIFLTEIGKALDYHSKNYESILIMGDFNSEEKCENISNFLDKHSLRNLIKVPTCLKSDSPRSIDPMLTTETKSFRNSTAIETGWSDFHRMIMTVLKDGSLRRSHLDSNV